MHIFKDRMRLPEEPTRYFDEKDGYKIKLLIQAAVNVVAPPGARMYYRLDFQDDTHNLPASLRLFFYENRQGNNHMMDNEASASIGAAIAQSIFNEFPLCVFKGTTASGRDNLTTTVSRQANRSAHEDFDCHLLLQQLFGAHSPLEPLLDTSP